MNATSGHSLLASVASNRFRAEMGRFVRAIAPAAASNSLALMVLKACTPGVPDFFQGTELFEATLTDPDNRRSGRFLGPRRPCWRRSLHWERGSPIWSPRSAACWPIGRPARSSCTSSGRFCTSDANSPASSPTAPTSRSKRQGREGRTWWHGGAAKGSHWVHRGDSAPDTRVRRAWPLPHRDPGSGAPRRACFPSGARARTSTSSRAGPSPRPVDVSMLRTSSECCPSPCCEKPIPDRTVSRNCR